MQKTRRAFVITAYRAGPDGVLEPEIPTEGVCAGQDQLPCKLHIDHRRERSTGPCFPLTVMRCRSHGRAFTLYPPGYVPYGRMALVTVAPDGSPIHVRDATQRFQATLFAACQDAAEGKAWHREHSGSSETWWGTQLRRLTLAAQLFGLAPEVGPRRRERVADTLGVDLLLLCDQAGQFCSARGYRDRGAAVTRILDALPQSDFLAERLVDCGTLANRWGVAYRWLPHSAALHRQPFRASGTRRVDRPP